MNPRLNLYVHIPEPIFKARVNMTTVTYPVSELTYDGVSLGAYTDIQFDATLILGTVEGSDDLGRVRVTKPADADTIFIARSGKGYEDGTIVVQDDAYIEVWDDYRVWAKIPYFQTHDDEVITDFKDGDVPVGEYTDAEIPPVSNCGPGVAGYIEQGPDTLTVQFPRDGVDVSFPMANGATIATYAWDVKDGTITVGTSASAVITATFPPGFRWVAMTVTDSNGISHTSRCPVLAIDPADDPTFKAFNVRQSFDRKGQTLSMKIFDELDRDTYPDGTLIMFWVGEAEDPGDRNHMRFIGWLDKENHAVSRIRTGIQKSTDLVAVDTAGRLSMLPGFPQALTRDEEAEQWSLMPELDMQKCLHYLLLWHSTALSVSDFTLDTYLTDYVSMRLDSGAASLFDQVDQQAQKIVPDHYLTCNAQGQLNVRRDWRLDDVIDRPIIADVVTVNEWNELTFEYNRHPKYHVLRSGAILASTDWVIEDDVETLPLAFSIAPSDSSAFSQGTNEMTQNEGLALTQEDLNKSEGHRFALINSRFGNFTWKDPTGEGFLLWEPALMNRIQLNLNALLGTYRGLPFTYGIGMCHTMNVDWTRNRFGTSVKATVTWTREEEGFPALTYDPDGDTTTPVPEDILFTPPSLGLLDGVEMVAGIDLDGNVYRTTDFQTPSGSGGPTWDSVDLGIAEALYTFTVDPFSPGYIEGSGSIDGWIATEDAIYRVEDLFGTTSATAVNTFDTAADAASFHWRTIQASFGNYFTEVPNPWLVCVSYYGDTTGHTGTWATYSLDGGYTWNDEVQISAHYDNGTPARFNPIGVFTSPRTPGLTYTAAYTSTTTPAPAEGFVSTDWGATWSAASWLDSGYAQAGTVHVPFEDNTDESILYHGQLLLAVGTPATDPDLMPGWGTFDDNTNTFTPLSDGPSKSDGVFARDETAGAPTPNVEDETYLCIVAPADTVRLIYRVDWDAAKSRAGASSSVAMTLDPQDSTSTSESGTSDFVAPATYPGTSSGSFDMEVTYAGLGDWPCNKDSVISSPPTALSQLGPRVRLDVIASCSGASNFAEGEINITVTVLEIELDDATVYTPTEGTNQRSFRLIRTTSEVAADISPEDTAIPFGPNRPGFTVRAHDSNRQKILVAGMGNDTSIDPDDDLHGVFISDDAGATWSTIVTPIADSGAPTNRPAFEAAFGGDSELVVFVWGPPQTIGYSDDFGATIDDRSGDLPVTQGFIGIAGGPTP